MSKIIDLGVLIKEPLIFKDLQGEEYVIPGNISTNFVIQFSKHVQDIQKLKSDVKAFEKMQQMVVDILNLDKSKSIDLEYVKEHFDDVRYLRIIVEEMMKHIKEIAEDPNFNSPESK